jgi:methyl-accepting chemotaxis protein
VWFAAKQRDKLRFSNESTILKTEIDTVTTNKALGGETGIEITPDYRGVPVLSAYTPVEIPGIRWALLSEIDQAEAFASSQAMLTVVLGVLVTIALITGVVAFVIARGIASPIMLIAEGSKRLAVGDAELSGIDWNRIEKIKSRKDELGVTGQSFSNLTSYFKEMSTASQQIAAGNLTVEVQPKGETDLLGNAFHTMVGNLRSLINKVSDTATNVGVASSQLSSAADQSGQATAQVAATIQQVAAGTAHQAEGMSKATDTVQQVARAIDGVATGAQEQAVAVARSVAITSQIDKVVQQVASNAQAGVSGSAEAADTARSGAQTIEATIAGMQSIKAKVGVSTQKVQEMGRRSDQIGAIVETIDDIASQTNLLALNAAIEAARAGEQGKGFAVVADEVRKLAEKAAGATKEIANLIKGIQQTVADAVAAMESGAAEVEVGVSRADEAGQALADILRAAELVNQQVESIATAAEEMATSSQELVTAMESVSAVVEENTASTQEMAAGSSQVLDAIENMASVTEENSAAVEEVNAAAEELNAQVEEVTASAQVLEEMAQILQSVMGQFELPAEKSDSSDLRQDAEVKQVVAVIEKSNSRPLISLN